MYTLRDSYGYLLSTVSEKMNVALEEKLKEHEITEKHLRILLAINQFPKYTQKQIGMLLGYDRTAMVLLIDLLEKLNYAQRVICPDDRRAYTIKMTLKGQKLLQEAIYIQDRTEKEILSNLEPLELKILKEVLVKALENNN